MKILLTTDIIKKVEEGLAAPSTIAVRRLIDLLSNRRRKNKEELVLLKETFSKIKSDISQPREDLIKLAEKNLRKNCCEVYYAKNKMDIVSIIKNIVSEEATIVKSKSNTMKELDIRSKLESEGFRIVETDFGDRIIQLSGGRSGHPIVPATHLSVEEVAKLFSEETGFDIEANPKEIVQKGKKSIKKEIIESEAGLTGANAISADDGAICIIENEGNISLITRIPKKHIVIAGIDKIVKSMDDALFQTLVIEKFSQIDGTYISLIKGPSRTADIGLEEVLGVYGAEEVHVILIDQWRSAAAEKGFDDMLKCVNCGACLISCPVMYSIGLGYGEDYPGGMGILKSSFIDGIEKTINKGLWLCLSCRRCQEFCPSDINIPQMLEGLREESFYMGCRVPQKIADFLRNIRDVGNPYRYSKKSRGDWTEDSYQISTKDDYLYYVGCIGSYDPRGQKMARSTLNLLKEANLQFGILGPREVCDGNDVNRIGERGLFERLVKENVEQLNGLNVEKIITLSPHAYNIMKNEYSSICKEFDYEVVHYTQILRGLIKADKIDFSGLEAKITFHDPCFLGRINNEYEAPRDILESIRGIELVEMKDNKEDSFCCGGGYNFFTDFLGNNEFCPSRVRVRMAHETGADILAVACPICLLMFDDAIKAENLGEEMVVRDISEIVNEAKTNN